MCGVNTEECAVVFADVVGSTRLYESAGDDRAQTLITELQNAISDVVRAMGGFVQEIVGDEVMLRFNDVDSGVSCACRIHEAVESFSARTGVQMSVRIGLHFGPVIVDHARVFGDTVNTASRIADIAQGGQTIITEKVVSQLTGSQRALARRFDEVWVKGKQEKLVVYDLPWRPANVTEIQLPCVAPSEQTPTLTLRYREASHSLPAARREFSIGRAETNDLVVISGSVSRRHATVEFARGRFVLTDTSTNGTYVLTQDGASVYLRRESLPLWGHGKVALGQPLSAGVEHLISFDCR
jgi:class 3 adenylate cyclase